MRGVTLIENVLSNKQKSIVIVIIKEKTHKLHKWGVKADQLAH